MRAVLVTSHQPGISDDVDEDSGSGAPFRSTWIGAGVRGRVVDFDHHQAQQPTGGHTIAAPRDCSRQGLSGKCKASTAAAKADGWQRQSSSRHGDATKASFNKQMGTLAFYAKVPGPLRQQSRRRPAPTTMGRIPFRRPTGVEIAASPRTGTSRPGRRARQCARAWLADPEPPALSSRPTCEPAVRYASGHAVRGHLRGEQHRGAAGTD